MVQIEGLLGEVQDKIDGIVQERCNSSVLTMELGLSCTNQLKWHISILSCITLRLSCLIFLFVLRWRGFFYNIDRCLYILMPYYYTPCFNEVKRGVFWFHLVSLFVFGLNRVQSVSSTILVRSISYLHILSSNFRKCVVCKVYFKIRKCEIWQIL